MINSPTPNLHSCVGAALAEHFGGLAAEARLPDTPPLFAVSFPAAPIPYPVFVAPHTQPAPYVHIETLVASEVDWDAGIARALLAENASRIFAKFALQDDVLVAEAELPAIEFDGATLACVVCAVAQVAAIGRELLDRAGLLDKSALEHDE